MSDRVLRDGWWNINSFNVRISSEEESNESKDIFDQLKQIAHHFSN